VLKDIINKYAILDSICGYFDQEGYQIGKGEARLIVTVLTTSNLRNIILFIDNGMLLGEAAYEAMFKLPGTHWKIIMVMPYSKVIEAARLIYRNSTFWMVMAMALLLLLMLAIMWYILIRPIMLMLDQLYLLAEVEEPNNWQLEVPDSRELGRLAIWMKTSSVTLMQQSAATNCHEKLFCAIPDLYIYLVWQRYNNGLTTAAVHTTPELFLSWIQQLANPATGMPCLSLLETTMQHSRNLTTDQHSPSKQVTTHVCTNFPKAVFPR